MRRIIGASVLALACLVPAAAAATHHACPQVTFTPKGNINVARKDCLLVYAPYPVGGPKSPCPPGRISSFPPRSRAA